MPAKPKNWRDARAERYATHARVPRPKAERLPAEKPPRDEYAAERRQFKPADFWNDT